MKLVEFDLLYCSESFTFCEFLLPHCETPPWAHWTGLGQVGNESSSSGIFSAAINAQCALHIVHYNTLHYSAMQNITPLNVYLQCRTSVNMKNTKCEILFYTDYPCS